MGYFLLGFVVGATVGATAVLLLTPSSGTDTRHGITARLNTALNAGQRASATHEQELWNTFRQRIADNRQAAANRQTPA